MTMRRHDLNLIPVLDALLRHRNVTRAGAELGLSQSATSHALTRLREQFGDRLLLQVGNELMISHRAEALRGLLADIMKNLEQLLEDEVFDPAQAMRRFKIGTADYIAQLLLPSVIREVSINAPQVTIQVTWDRDNMPQKLRTRQLDIALVPRGTLDESDLHSSTLFGDELVVIASREHAQIGDTLTLEDYLAAPHASFRRENAPEQSFAEQQLAQSGIAPRQTVLVADFLVLAFIVSTTQCLSLIPRRMAEKMQDAARLRLFPPPFTTSRLHVQAYWSHDADSDPGHRWFREVLHRACQNL